MTNDTLAVFVTQITAQKAAWLAAKARQEEEARLNAEAGISVLSGFTHIVVDGAIHLALDQEGSRFTPIVIRPEGSPMTIWSRETAEKIAAARGDSYHAIPLRELADRRLSALDSMLTTLIGESAAITL